MPETRLGIRSKLYVNEGSYGTPDWLELDLISDFSQDVTWDTGDSSARRSIVKTAEPTQLNLGGTGRIRKDSTDDGYNFARDACINRATVDVMELDGAHDQNGSTGFRYEAKITSFSEDQAMGNVLYNDFTLTPCAHDADEAPQAVVVTAGDPVFSDIGGPAGSA